MSSVPDLLRELSSEGATLFRQEIALARAELGEKLEVYRRGSISMAVGGALLLASMFFLLWVLNHGLTVLLAQLMGLEIAVWLAPLLLAATLGGVGWSMLKEAQQRIADEGITPHETLETLREDQLWVRRKAREVKEEMRDG